MSDDNIWHVPPIFERPTKKETAEQRRFEAAKAFMAAAIAHDGFRAVSVASVNGAVEAADMLLGRLEEQETKDG